MVPGRGQHPGQARGRHPEIREDRIDHQAGAAERCDAKLGIRGGAHRVVDLGDDLARPECLDGELGGHDVAVVALGQGDEQIRILGPRAAQDVDHGDRLFAFGDLDGLRGRDLFFRGDGKRPRLLGRGLRLGLLATLVGDGDRALLRHDLDVALGFGVLLLHRADRDDVGALARLLRGRLALRDGLLHRDARFFLRALGGLFGGRGLRAVVGPSGLP